MDSKRYRLNEFIRPADGRGLLLDASGGLIVGAPPGLEDFTAAVEPVLPQLDGLIAATGQINALAAGRTREQAALLARADWTNALRGEDFVLPPEQVYYFPLLEPADARDLGASAVVTHFLLGYSEQIDADCVKTVVQFALAGSAVGLPLLVDVQPVGPRVRLRSKAIELGVSYALEGGADGITIPWPGAASFKTIQTMAAGLPVWVKPESVDPGAPELAEALALGAAGPWLDAAVFAEPDPAAIIAAFAALTHAAAPVAAGGDA